MSTNWIKRGVRRLMQRYGLDIVRRHNDTNTEQPIGVSPFSDIQLFLQSVEKPNICDIGANMVKQASS